jgi:hypothetical protein
VKLEDRVRFFRWTAALAVVAAGVLLAVQGGALLQSSWAPATLALTQVPGPRGIVTVLALMWFGLITLMWGLLWPTPWILHVSLTALMVAVPIFAVAVLRALRGVHGDPACRALRVALWSLLLSAGIGVWMLHGHAGMRFPGPRPLWLQVHLGVALFGWLGGVFASLGSPTRREIALLVVGIVLPPVVLLVDAILGSSLAAAPLAAVAASPAAAVVWGVQPLRELRTPASDPGYTARRAGFAFAPGAALAAFMVVARDAPDWNLLFGWIALWGWAGLVVHGLLQRPGRPSPAVGLALHLAALAAGVAATLTGLDALARLTGALIAATGLSMLRGSLLRSA